MLFIYLVFNQHFIVNVLTVLITKHKSSDIRESEINNQLLQVCFSNNLSLKIQKKSFQMIKRIHIMVIILMVTSLKSLVCGITTFHITNIYCIYCVCVCLNVSLVVSHYTF